MANENREIKLTLTDEQKRQIKQESGKDASAIAFTVEELESRIAPRQVLPTDVPVS